MAIKSVKAITTLRQRQRVKNMIKDLGSLKLEAHVKNDDFDSLVNYIIEINGCIQKIVWEGGLLRSCNTPKYILVVFNIFRVFCRHNLNFS